MGLMSNKHVMDLETSHIGVRNCFMLTLNFIHLELNWFVDCIILIKVCVCVMLCF